MYGLLGLNCLIFFRIAGYNWWSYYKKIQAASVRIDGPRAVIQDNLELASSQPPQPTSTEIAAQSYNITTTNNNNTSISDSEELALIPSPRPNTNAELDDDCDCQICSETLTIPEIKSVDSASVLVSVIVHSPNHFETT